MLDHSEFYLGIDGGGSKTTVVITASQGVELGRGSGGPGNLASSSDATLIESLRCALDAAGETAGLKWNQLNYCGVCAGMAGYSAENRRNEFETLLRNLVSSTIYRIEPDYVTAYWGASHGQPGIVVIAGTGAVAYGRNAQGESFLEDGLGYLLGDLGGGFDLGITALRHAVRHFMDGEADGLTNALLSQLGTQTRNEIVQWLYTDFSPARVASLAPIIGSLAREGNPVATALLCQAAARLKMTVLRLMRRLQLPDNAPIYPMGGLWNLGEIYRTAFSAPSHSQNGTLQLTAPLSDAAIGAALLVISRGES